MKSLRDIIDNLIGRIFKYRCKLCGKKVTMPVGYSEVNAEAVGVGLCLNCMSWVRLEE